MLGNLHALLSPADFLEINPFVPNEIPFSYQMDQSTSVFRVVG